MTTRQPKRAELAVLAELIRARDPTAWPHMQRRKAMPQLRRDAVTLIFVGLPLEAAVLIVAH
jgi:hypothetical protein